MDLQKNRKFHKGERPKIELGAVLDTNCRKCGGHGNSQIPVHYSSTKRFKDHVKCLVFIYMYQFYLVYKHILSVMRVDYDLVYWCMLLVF